MRALPVQAKALVIATGTLTVGVLVLAVRSGFGADHTMFLLLLAAAVVTELCYVEGSEEPIHASATHGFSFSTGVHLGAAYLLGPWQAATIALLGTVFVDVLRGHPGVKVVYNGAVFALATAAAGLVFEAIGGTIAHLDLPGDMPAVVGSVAVYLLVNVSLVSAIVGIVTATPISPTLTASVQAEISSTAAEAGVAVAIALFAVHAPWGLVTLVPLLLAAYQSHKRLALLQDETSEALLSLAELIDERDPYTFQHSQRVSQYVHQLGKALGLPGTTVTRFRWAARVHDLGKVSLESSILHKPGRLDTDEWKQMRRHPRTAARLIHGFRFVHDQARMVECHHERYDGRGYYGIRAEDLPLGAHFLTVADTFDAMTSDRPYRRGLTTEEALREIERHAGTQFHPSVARAFVTMIRGGDPATALSPVELLELRREARPEHRRLLESLRGLRWHDDAAIITGVLVVLVGVAVSAVPAVVLGLPLLVAGVVGRAIGARRRDALAAALDAALDATLVPARRLQLILAALVPVAKVRWGALVRWDEASLDTAIVLEDGIIHDRPPDAALAGWLLQQTRSSQTSTVQGSAIGSSGEFVAVPLRTGEDLVGFLVIGSGGRLPCVVGRALGACGPRLASALDWSTSAGPALRAVS